MIPSNLGTVVCAIDVNDFSAEQVELAAQLANSMNLPLDLVHVTVAPDPVHSPWPAYLGPSSQLICDNRRLRELQPSVKGLAVRHHHLSGRPVQQLVDFVERNQPRLLVLGTHARTGLARVFGSVAMAILRQVNCPVMILKQGRVAASIPANPDSHTDDSSAETDEETACANRS